jgi:hypothetical protein
MERIGKALVVGGLLLAAVGLAVWLLGDKLRWLGRLPGDIRIEREHLRVYVPLTTMFLISLLLSLLMWVIQRLK